MIALPTIFLGYIELLVTEHRSWPLESMHTTPFGRYVGMRSGVTKIKLLFTIEQLYQRWTTHCLAARGDGAVKFRSGARAL